MSKNVLIGEFDNNKVVYHGGETISGRLFIDSDESIDVYEFQVVFSGKARVRWSEGGGNNSKVYWAKQRLFKEKVDLTGSLGSQMQLPSGRSTFPFSFELPQELPSSIEVPGGYVRYSVKGCINRRGLRKNIGTKIFFTVLDVLDLNQVPRARHPSAKSKSKNLCCCWCTSGPIECKVNADKTAYVPGEFIKANGSIENLSNSDLPESYFSIVQRVTQHVGSHSRTFDIKLVKVPGISCKRRSTVQLSPQTLQLPPVPPSYLRYCDVMDIEYFLRLCVETTLCHTNLRVNAPLKIGTIPLRDNDAGMLEPASVAFNTAESSFQPPPSTPAASAPPAYQPPPPSYAAATSVTIPQKGDYSGPTTYAPQYNYYEWS